MPSAVSTVARALVVVVVGLVLMPTVRSQQMFDRTLTNPTAVGSSAIPCTIWTPAISVKKPWPVVALLHGHGFLGRDYKVLGSRLAADGYLVIAPNTARVDGWLQGLDALALPAALALEDRLASSPLYAAIDLARRAILGHSMGAANVVRVLAEDRAWRLGIAITPLIAPLVYPPRVTAPLVLIGCKNDTVTPWRQNLLAIRTALPSSLPAWTTTIWDENGNHLNPVFRDFANSTTADDAIFDATYRTCSGALRRWIADDAGGLDDVVGTRARMEPRLHLLEHRFASPEHYATSSPTEFRLHVAGPDGPVLELGSLQTANLKTPFGELGLSPLSLMIAPAVLMSGGRVTTLTFAREPRFLGLDVWFQSLSLDASQALRLGRVIRGRLGR